MKGSLGLSDIGGDMQFDQSQKVPHLAGTLRSRGHGHGRPRPADRAAADRALGQRGRRRGAHRRRIAQVKRAQRATRRARCCRTRRWTSSGCGP